MHQWLRDAGVKGGDAKGDKMVQAGREVVFKIKNAYFQEVLQSQLQRIVPAGKGSGGFLPNQWTKVGQDKSVPIRPLPTSRQVAAKGVAKKIQSRKYRGAPDSSALMPTMNQALHLPPKLSPAAKGGERNGYQKSPEMAVDEQREHVAGVGAS